MKSIRLFRIGLRLDSFRRRFNIKNAIDSTRKVIMPLPPKRATAVGDADYCFVDHCRVLAVAGKGGDGGLSFLSLPRKQWAGPDGGEGGNGGHVIFIADKSLLSLNHLPFSVRAKNGENGRRNNCYGASAPPLEVKVPIGTIFRNVDNGEILGELNEDGEMFIAARGGAGGHGNRFYLSNENRAPTVAEEGAEGETIFYNVELRMMANVGLVGFPNAGKSTFLRAISRARPKIASYPFTTMQPHVGMVEYEDYSQIAVADIPGLIPGSHDNAGLGFDFLRHIERCAALAYVIDLSWGDEPQRQIESLNVELEEYKVGLSKRPSMIIANKIDLPSSMERCEKLKSWTSLSVYAISAKYRRGITECLIAMRQLCDEHVIRSNGTDDNR